MPQTPYNPLTPEIVTQLEAIVGPRYVLHGDAERLEPFSHDEVPDPHYRHMPECVVRPDGAEEIAAILKLANRERIAVTPRGAGSGLSGGAVPIQGGIVLLCDRMNRILDIDPANMTITCEPGVVTSEINPACQEHDLFYAGYPMSLETCYIGGNVAENAGGGKAVKYGVTSRYVVGMEIVTPTGEIVALGGKLSKDVTGYNMIQLMVGSEGTLCVFTKIILKLLPTPKASVDLLCLYKTAAEAVAAVPKIQTGSGTIPTAIEFLSRTVVQAACEYLNESLPYQNCGAMLLLTVDGADEAQVEREYEAIGEICLATGAMEVYVADNATTSERVWRVRRNVAEAFGAATCWQANEDLVVPISGIAELVAKIEELSTRFSISAVAYGHAGDGNIHVRIVKPDEMPMETWEADLPKLLAELYETTVALGGKLSGEHGIGHKRKKYMPIFCSEASLDMMRSIKRALDPNNILNPGKVIDV